MHRAVVIILSLAAWSCASSLAPCLGDPENDLVHGDPKCKINAAIAAAEAGRLDLFPRLLANLRDDNGDVRMLTGVAVRKLGALDLGFRPYATQRERDEAIARWRDWWQLQSGAASQSSDEETEQGDGFDGDAIDARYRAR